MDRVFGEYATTAAGDRGRRTEPWRTVAFKQHQAAGNARRQLVLHAAFLSAQAAVACDRDGLPPEQRDIPLRVGSRIGLPAAAVADHAARSISPSRDRLRGLADEVLGQKEREVFLALIVPTTVPGPSAETVALRCGLSVQRLRAIEVSARRKIAVALNGPSRRVWPAFLGPAYLGSGAAPCRTRAAS